MYKRRQHFVNPLPTAAHRASAWNRTLQRLWMFTDEPRTYIKAFPLKLRNRDGIAQTKVPLSIGNLTDKMLPLVNFVPVQVFSYVIPVRKITRMNAWCACTKCYIRWLHPTFVPTQARRVHYRGRLERSSRFCLYAFYENGILPRIYRSSSTFCYIHISKPFCPLLLSFR